LRDLDKMTICIAFWTQRKKKVSNAFFFLSCEPIRNRRIILFVIDINHLGNNVN
jgi:hypothetical protein